MINDRRFTNRGVKRKRPLLPAPFKLAPVLLLFLAGCASREKAPSPLPAQSRQLLLVITPDFDAPDGLLHRFERQLDQAWQEVRQPIPAALGRSGLGWGRGEHKRQASGPQKREGDGRSPAGIFHLGKVFGFKTLQEIGPLKMPYVQVTETLECVDDPKSRWYNRIVDRASVDTLDWQSSEKMHAIGQSYHLGVTVQHNHDFTVDAGSCIFLHIWSGPGDTTAGCTAIAEPNLQEIVGWLDENKTPMIVQLTDALYREFGERWKLPKI